METNELMIGDWVLLEGTPAKIVGVEIYGSTLYVQTNLTDAWYMSKFEPIQLTKEILEKNADSHFDERVYDIYCFHNKDDDNYDHLVEITSIHGQFEWTINGNEYGIAEIKYVHELQHALRLCKVDKEIVL